MNSKKLYLINIIALFMTVPWFFYGNNTGSILGFPYWAFYSLFATFIYAIIIFYFINKYWFISESSHSTKD